MIIKGLFTLLYNLFDTLTSAIDIPNLPSDIDTTINSALGYIQGGFDYLRFFTHWNFLMILLGISLVVGTVFKSTGLLMWILKKIPFLGIE